MLNRKIPILEFTDFEKFSISSFLINKRTPEISNEIPKIIRNNSLSMGNLPPIQANGAEKIISARTFFPGD